MAIIICSQFLNHIDCLPEPHLFHSHILNLSKGASQTEVHERYRTLSLVFHPDKQQDPQAKEVAARNFLEIQKAYQGCFLAFAVLTGVSLTACE
jgi:preprotein translocase subunit Sec63